MSKKGKASGRSCGGGTRRDSEPRSQQHLPLGDSGPRWASWTPAAAGSTPPATHADTGLEALRGPLPGSAHGSQLSRPFPVVRGCLHFPAEEMPPHYSQMFLSTRLMVWGVCAAWVCVVWYVCIRCGCVVCGVGVRGVRVACECVGGLCVWCVCVVCVQYGCVACVWCRCVSGVGVYVV